MAGYKRKRKVSKRGKRKTYKRINVRTGGFRGMEVKFTDVSRERAVLASGTMTGLEADPSTKLCLNSLTAGPGESQRIGRKIHMLSIQLAGVIDTTIMSLSTMPLNNTYFVALVLDTQTNGAQLASELVFKNNSGVVNTCTAPFRNLKYVDRFKVLWSKQLKRNPAGSTQHIASGSDFDTAGTITPFKMNMRLNIDVLYDDTTGNVSAITDNSLHIIACTNSELLAPFIRYNCRIRYTG